MTADVAISNHLSMIAPLLSRLTTVVILLNLISKNKETREKLHDKTRELYDARSAIVHGGDKQRAFKCINNPEVYEEIIRTVIIVFIDTMKSLDLDHREMIRKLDCDETDIYEIGTISWKP